MEIVNSTFIENYALEIVVAFVLWIVDLVINSSNAKLFQSIREIRSN